MRDIVRAAMFVLFSLTLVLPALAVKNAPNVTLVASDLSLCNNGTIELNYTICPTGWSAGALPSTAIEGWLSVTTAVDATGTGTRYDIGGGNNYGTDLADVPWGSLQPGDAVNIYYRATPYREKIPISERGTLANPIIINGVTDGAGNRPEINGENAVNVAYANWTPGLESAVILMHRKPLAQGGVNNITAEYIKFQNIKVVNSRDTMSYTHNVTTSNYPIGGRLFWLRDAKHITIENCIIHDGGEGIFVQSPDGGEGYARDITIRGNWFKGNGQEDPPSNAHQVYLLAASEGTEKNIIEGNFFDLAGDSEIAQIKLRTTDTIVRYNTVVGNARMLDIVEAQNGVQEAVFGDYTAQEIIDRYRTSYVYGNLFINDSRTSYPMASYPIHSGWDSFELNTNEPGLGEPSNRGIDGGTTHFFHNTLHYHSVYASGGLWRGGIFQPGHNDEVAADQGSITSYNNIVEFGGDLVGAHGRLDGVVTYESTNLIYSSTLQILAESDSYANSFNSGDDPQIAINHHDTRITTSANFVDDSNANVLLRDYTPNTGSPAIDAATALPAALSGYPVEYNPVNPATGIRTARSATNDLGAFE